jgi:hypothetical protein
MKRVPLRPLIPIVRPTVRENKQPLRAFLQHYSDERLTWLLAHAQSGQLVYSSCCCFIGVATADHALRSDWEHRPDGQPVDSHYNQARQLPGSWEAELAFLRTGPTDAARCRFVIPLIKAEMLRRARVAELLPAAEVSA